MVATLAALNRNESSLNGHMLEVLFFEQLEKLFKLDAPGNSPNGKQPTTGEEIACGKRSRALPTCDMQGFFKEGPSFELIFEKRYNFQASLKKK